MSLDARYLLVYDDLGYVGETPMEKDIHYLQSNYGGSFEYIEYSSIYWDKPKYTLPKSELEKLYADQVLERKDCELWKIVK